MNSSSTETYENFAEVIKNIDGQKSWRCVVCGKCFGRKDNFKKHLMIHAGEKPFICPYCNFRSVRKGNLKGHIFTKHADIFN